MRLGMRSRAGWDDFECAPRSLCAYSAERLFIISRLSRPAGRSKRYFHGRGRGGKRHLQRLLPAKARRCGVTPSVIACGDATFPKGTALVVAGSFAAAPKGVPLGELAANAGSRLRGVPRRGLNPLRVCFANPPPPKGEALLYLPADDEKLPLRGSWRGSA